MRRRSFHAILVGMAGRDKNKDIRAGKITLILFNAANAIGLGFVIGRWFTFPFPSRVLPILLALLLIDVVLGVAWAIYIVWREHA